MIGMRELNIVLVIVLLVFGTKRLTGGARDLGKAVDEFRVDEWLVALDVDVTVGHDSPGHFGDAVRAARHRPHVRLVAHRAVVRDDQVVPVHRVHVAEQSHLHCGVKLRCCSLPGLIMTI